jgi:hypothetical protein
MRLPAGPPDLERARLLSPLEPQVRAAMDAMTRREALEATRGDDARHIQPRRFEIVLRCAPSPRRVDARTSE